MFIPARVSGLRLLAPVIGLRLRQGPSGPIRWVVGVITIVAVVAVWAVVTSGEAEYRMVSPALLPSPLEVAQSVGSLLLERGLIDSIFASLLRVALGFGLAVAVGVPLGMVSATWRVTQSFLAPLVLLGRNIPLAALIPLTLVWFGIGELQKVMFLFIACVPFIIADSAASVLAIHERYVETAQTLGASSRQIFIKVLAPLALPSIYTSLRHLFGLAFGYIMLAELIDAKHGLGYLIQMSMRRSNYEHIYLLLVVIGIVAYGLDRLLAYFERGLFPYKVGE